MIVRGESTIIDYNAPFDQGFRFGFTTDSIENRSKETNFTNTKTNFIVGKISYKHATFTKPTGVVLVVFYRLCVKQ